MYIITYIYFYKNIIMLIIYAHPDREWHCGYLLQETEKKLKKKKIKYRLVDLYEDKFRPILSKDELYTRWNKGLSKEVKTYQKLLKKHDKIIIIYPTWWNGTPAILKGFFDKVLTAHFAFKYIKWLPVWLLKWKAAVITTTWWPSLYQVLFAKNRSIKTVVDSTLKFCWFKARWFLVWSANKLTDKQKLKINKTVEKVLKYLK